MLYSCTYMATVGFKGLKQKRFEFTPETVVCNELVAQVGRKTVPNKLRLQ